MTEVILDSNSISVSVGFDAMKYIASYGDLIKAFGTNTAAATRHYAQWGYNEGRTVNFDAMKYIASNGDLIKVFGTDTVAATTHYVQWGYNEGRTVNFDARLYLANYAGLRNAFGTDTVAATAHYVQWGYSEGRVPTFDAMKYIASYGDLISAFGTNTAAGTSHYLNWGESEGRTSSFDVQFYRAKYYDVRNAFGVDNAAATKHFVQYGYNEHRTAANGGDDMLIGTEIADRLDAGAGNDYISGSGGDDMLIAGAGYDTLSGGSGKDTIDLTELAASTGDTVQIAAGDSLVSSYDLIIGFELSTYVSPHFLASLGGAPVGYADSFHAQRAASTDKLDLPNTSIATDVAAYNGVNAGTGTNAIMSHSISNGIISFGNTDNYITPVTITAATNLGSVFSYLQANITGGDTVAFVEEGNTFVFQDGGATNDTLVELVGISARGITSGAQPSSSSGSVWIV